MEVAHSDFGAGNPAVPFPLVPFCFATEQVITSMVHEPV